MSQLPQLHSKMLQPTDIQFKYGIIMHLVEDIDWLPLIYKKNIFNV